jgi:hypothetical protein
LRLSGWRKASAVIPERTQSKFCASRNSASRQPHDRPSQHFTCGPDPLSGSDSTLRVSPIRHHCGTSCRMLLPIRDPLLSQSRTARSPFQGLVPFSVFPITRSLPRPTRSQRAGPLRPQGFAPSRRFAPRIIYRAYSIPIPLLGFSLRGLAPRVVPYALLDAAPLRILRVTPL